MTFEIIVPGRFLEPKDPIGLSVGMEGWYELAAIKNGRVVRERSFRASDSDGGALKNLILNSGLDGYGTRNYTSLYGALSVGIGTTPPSVSDTGLVNPILERYSTNRSAVRGERSELNDWRCSLTLTWTTAIGQLGNNNLTELGVGGSGASDPLYSRVLIVDSVGNPVAFPIAADEQLQVSYTLRMYPPLEDSVSEVEIAGTRTAIVRPIALNNHPQTSGVSGWGLAYNFSGHPNNNYGFNSRGWYTGDLVGMDEGNSQPSGSVSLSSGSPSNLAYVAGSHKRAGRATWSSSEAVNSNLRTHRIEFGGCAFQVQYDPPIEKTADQTMFLEYEFGWARR